MMERAILKGKTTILLDSNFFKDYGVWRDICETLGFECCGTYDIKIEVAEAFSCKADKD